MFTSSDSHWFNYEFMGNRIHNIRLRERWLMPYGRIQASHFIASKFLERSVELDTLTVKDKNVLELGAGCGLMSVVAAFLGAKTVATNPQEGYEITDVNINSSKYVCDPSTKKMTTLPLSSQVLNWGDDISSKFTRGSFDYILGADLISEKTEREPLLATLLQLVNGNTTVFFSHLWCRRPHEEEFIYKQMGEFFDIHETATDAEISAYAEIQLKSNHPNASTEERRRSSSISVDNLAAPKRRMSENPDEYEEENIVIFELHLKPEFCSPEGIQRLEKRASQMIKESSMLRKMQEKKRRESDVMIEKMISGSMN